jgi:deoxycytidylate deaminase
LLQRFSGLEIKIDDSTEAKRVDTLMTACNELRQKTQRGDILAALAIGQIKQHRDKEKPSAGIAYIFRSLKHPDEAELLRDIHGDGFYLLSISSSRTKRLEYLTEQQGMTKEEAKRLMKRDEEEEFELGQHMRDAFYLADCFVDIDADDASSQIARFLDLIFGEPYLTPTNDEYAMFLAFASSLRSGDLSRQVGAVVTSAKNEVIATGANDVPCFGGGLYWTNHGESDNRDYKIGYDSNELRKYEIINSIIKILKEITDSKELLQTAMQNLKGTGIFEITEYGRAVHAEMEAILSCARSGVTPRGGTLYTTTFPCHNCAKHIIATGIERVVFVEPYPKSFALALHSDAIMLAHDTVASDEKDKVKFEPFVGIGPRRFMDLFSITLSSGKKIKRKENGKIVNWERNSASVKIPLLSMSYIERERYLNAEIDQTMEKINAISKKQ